LRHRAYEVSEPRVRLYGNAALVTTKVHNAGTFGSKPFDVMERETDVWIWKDGSWKCVLTHEAWEGAEKHERGSQLRAGCWLLAKERNPRLSKCVDQFIGRMRFDPNDPRAGIPQE
jgi:hypothetical protein